MLRLRTFILALMRCPTCSWPWVPKLDTSRLPALVTVSSPRYSSRLVGCGLASDKPRALALEVVSSPRYMSRAAGMGAEAGHAEVPGPGDGAPPQVHAQSAGLGDNEVSRSGNNRGPRDSVCQVTDLVGHSEILG